MLLYRAMCVDEFARTVKYGKADFTVRRNAKIRMVREVFLDCK